MSLRIRFLGLASLCGLLAASSGCVHFGSCSGCGPRTCRANACGYDSCGCDPCGDSCGTARGCRTGCGPGGCGVVGGAYRKTSACLTNADLRLCSAFYQRSNAIPDTLPLGTTNRAWYQVMETNAEAVDFIIYSHDFVGDTARLTPDGRDHLWEIAARMRSTPFPVVVERSENNSNPELDAHRRQLVVAVLSNFGNADAEQRTVVSTPYGPGYNGFQAESMYYRHVGGGGYNNSGSFGNNLGSFGGFGGGGGGGIGFSN
ncbi:MAG: hypothetical protein ACK5Q5_08270 [Planctomycetaceae bacterium]